MGGDVPVDSETPVVTSSISRPNPSAQSLGVAHRNRVCVYAFIGVSECTCCERLRTMFLKKIILANNIVGIMHRKFMYQWCCSLSKVGS